MISRRRFVHGFAGAAFVLGAARWNATRGAETRPGAVLSGTQFDLTIDELPVNYTGARRTAIAINGQVPGPTLRFREGDTVTIRVTNRLRTTTALHWHGLIVPADMDGVPGVSFAGIEPGATFEYRFKVNQSGTYWYHAHARFQEQVGLYGSIVIDPRNGERHVAQREHVVLFSDWSDLDPEDIYRTLKLQSDYFNLGKRTAADFMRDARSQGLGAAFAERRAWGAMRMQPTDLADVSAYAYTYLTNGATPAGNWTGTFAKGERVRLRFINGSSMSVFDVRIPDLKLTVVAADGQDIEPVTVDELRIAAAEVFDVIVEPQDDRAYTIFAQSIDRSGYARGTLAPRAGMEAPVPPLDARPVLAMSDMGMAHGGGEHAHHGEARPTRAQPTSADGGHAHGDSRARISTIPARACATTVGGCSPTRTCTRSAGRSIRASRGASWSCASPVTCSASSGRSTAASSPRRRRCASRTASGCASRSSTTR